MLWHHIYAFRVCFRGVNWFNNAIAGVETPVGTVIISALGIIVGFQLFLSFLSYDISNYPSKAVSPNLDNEFHSTLIGSFL